MVKQPAPATLRKYGLTPELWNRLAASQGFACFVCLRQPSTGRLCVDHEHVKGWKKLPPEERRRYVRGLLCWTCNHFAVGRGVTLERARRVVAYLARYEATQVQAPPRR